MGEFAERVRVLALPLDEIIIIGSGALAIRNLRPAGDVDIVATAGLYQRLHDQASVGRRPWQLSELHDRQRLVHQSSAAEVWASWDSPDGRLDYEQLIPETEEIDGIRLMNLDFVRRWKQWRDRPKDRADVALIDHYRREAV